MSSSAPNLLSLINKRLGDPGEAQQFFGVKKELGPAWVKSIKPGIDASQRVLGAYMAEQSTGDAEDGNFDKIEEHRKRAALCHELFGNTDIIALESLVSELKHQEHVRIDFRKKGEKMEATISIPKPEAKIEQPPGGFFPPPVKYDTDSKDIAELAAKLRPRVIIPKDVESTPAELGAILDAVLHGQWTRKVAMLLPVNRDINPHVVYGLMAQVRKQPWLGVHYHADTVIQHARNILVQKFLESEAEWSFWLDSDMVAPFGDPGFFYDTRKLGCDPSFIKPEFTSVLAVERLMKAQKTIIGGVYQMRQSGVNIPMVIQPNLHPRGPQDQELVASLNRSGPRNEVVQVGYVATGCALIHRSVYRDIQNRFPELQPRKDGEPFDFFGHDVGKGGEDIHFCDLATQAGHPSYLDLGLWCAHVGNHAFFPLRKV